MKSLISILVILLSFQVWAGGATGKVRKVVVRESDGLVYVLLRDEDLTSARPACAIGTSYWMIKNEDSEAGKRQLSLLLTALTSGKKVQVEGHHACTRWGDGEDIKTVFLTDED